MLVVLCECNCYPFVCVDGVNRIRIPRPAPLQIRGPVQPTRPRGGGVVPCDRCGALLTGKPTAGHYRSVNCFSAYCARGLQSGSLVIDTGRGVGGGGGCGGGSGGGDDASAAAVAAAVAQIAHIEQLLHHAASL